MRKAWQKVRKKIRGIILVWKNDSSLIFLKTEDQFLRENIANGIRKGWRGPNNAKETDFFWKLVDEVWAQVTNNDGRSIQSIKSAAMDGFLSQQFQYYSFLCGFVCSWELQFKILAENYNVRTAKTSSEKSKKDRLLGTVVYRDTADIIKDFNKVTGYKLNLRLEELSKLRNALVHGSLQQLRRYANVSGKEIKERHKGNVMMVSLSGEDAVNLSTNHSDDERDGQAIFGWFLEGTNSALLHDIFIEFEKSFEQLKALMTFKAFESGHEKDFEKVFKGQKLTKAEEEEWFKMIGIVSVPNPNFFKVLYTCFKKLK